ncbi:MAG: LTA synthase family protein [Clostridia bacterium]|nr:LTA synthase family protein [Clostridia bacterium]
MLNFIVEMLSRHSLIEAVIHLCTKPLSFLCNTLIILLTMTVSLFFKRRLFFMAAISSIWVLLGIANAVVLIFRNTPLNPVDFQIMQTAVQVVNFYLDTIHFILIGLLLATIAGASILLWRKAPKFRPHLTKAMPIFIGVLAATYVATSIAGKTTEADGGFTNLVDAYDRYGFAFCFAQGIFNEGIEEPEDYSVELVDSVTDRLPTTPERAQNSALPNIIFVQLESFFDPQTLSGVAFAQNPLPTFTALRDVYPSGMLTVPTVGAGTVNTEFEVLTGMSLKFFGTGEYPYKTILKEVACESLASDLKKIGYSTTAMHNNDGLFYQRNVIFPQLGFDRFVSMEYMHDVTYNKVGWARDEVLTSEIMAVLNETVERDFVYAISVQTHGKYESDPEMKEGNFIAYGIDDADQKAQMEYYVGQLAQTDAFIADLVNALNASGEPYVLVLFGDHLPTLEQANVDQLPAHNLYQTEYVVCNNIGLAFEEQPLTSYQLAAELLESLGYPGNPMMRLHRSSLAESTESYLSAMHILQYDMLYGERYALDGIPAKTAAMQMGLYQADIDSVETDGETLIVTGTYFTPFAKIAVNGEIYETEFVSETELRAYECVPELGDLISVCFAGDNLVVLSETETVPY